MRKETREIKKIEYEYTYVADDGTEFKSEEECRKYEQTAQCAINAMFEKLPKQETFDPTGGSFPYFGSEETIIAVKVDTLNDVETINKWIMARKGNKSADCIGAESVGTIQLFGECDGDWLWRIGTPDELKKTCCEAIDTWFDKLTEKTKE